MRCILRCTFALSAVAALNWNSASAVVLDHQHVDIGVAYEDDAWDLHVHDETNDVEYEPGEALLYVGALDPPATQPVGAEWEFIGAGAGQEYWLLPAQQTPGMLFLGIGTEEIAPGTFLEYFETDPRVDSEAAWITLSLRDVRGPGEVALWTTDGFGSPTAWMSTFDGGITAADAAFLLEDSHQHFNLGFTEPGLYEIDLQASAYLPDGSVTTSDVATYHFGVNAVPEPATWGLAALAGLALALAHQRVRRAAI